MRAFTAISCGLLVGFATPVLAQNSTAVQTPAGVKSHHVGGDSAERDRRERDKADGQREETTRSERLKQDQAVGQREETTRADKLKQDKAVGQREETARADKMKQGDLAAKRKKSASDVASQRQSNSPK